MSLLVRRGRTLEHPGLVDIEVSGQSIVNVGKKKGEADQEIDAEENLILPTFVEPHVHLDKAFLAEKGLEAKTIAEARQLVKEAKRSFTVDDITSRAERCLGLALANGVTALRTHVDVDGIVGLKGVEALTKLKKKYKDLMDFQVVAFPQEGVVKEKGAYELMERALDLGATVVGGLPETELNEEDRKKHIDMLFDLAVERDLDLDLHCDVLPVANTIQYYAAQVAKRRYGGRATADHIIALSYRSDHDAAAVIQLLRTAEMNVVVNPCTMMTSGVLDPPPKGRGITRVKELIEAGINVSYGLDNVVDPYNPYGEFDPLRNGWLLAYQAFLNLQSHTLQILKMCTYNAAKILRMEGYGLKPGSYADFNIIDASSPREALRRRTAPLYVVRRGKVVAENKVKQKRSF